MSDTPETDAIDAEIVQLVADAIKNNVALSDVLGMALTKHVNLQKKLERERNEARNQLKELIDENAEHVANVVKEQQRAEKAEAERDQLKRELQAAHMQIDLDKKSDEERDQLRKVADAMAEQYRYEMMSMFGHASDCDCSRCEPMTKLYNSLPHVIERNKAK